MNRAQFSSFALDCGPGIAYDLAICAGVKPAQVELWLHSLDQFTKSHHWLNLELAARSVH